MNLSVDPPIVFFSFNLREKEQIMYIQKDQSFFMRFRVFVVRLAFFYSCLQPWPCNIICGSKKKKRMEQKHV